MKILKSAIFLAGVLALTGVASQAATVTWGAPTDINGVSDIITAGTLVAAVNADNGGNVVVDPAGLNMTFTPDNTMFPTQNPFTTSFAPTTGDAGFDAVLNRADWDGTSPNATVVSIAGLTSGAAYQIQMFVADTRGCCNTRSMDITGGLNTVSVFMGNVGGAPARAQFVVGSFTADAATQDFTFSGTHPSAANLRHPQLNAYVLRQVPEPSTFGLVALAGIGVLLRRRR